MKSLGCKRVISPCAVGSLQKEIAPGDFVICDQFVNFTSGRKDTFYEGPICTHISVADPYCPELRELAIKVAEKNGVNVHKTGTMLVINGPRFSTKAESKFFTSWAAAKIVKDIFVPVSPSGTGNTFKESMYS